jgi:hypothetical protein
MNKFLPVAFLTPLLIGACRPADTTGADMMDVIDMAMPPQAMATTIRDLNSAQNTVKVGTRVKITGVVTSPMRWVTGDDAAGYCYYRVHIVQTDPAPATLGDGMILTLSLRTTMWTDGSTLTQCKDRAKSDTVAMAMDTLVAGQLVEVEGSYDTRANCGATTRQINMFGGKIVSQGMAPTQPTPIDVDPTQYVTATGTSKVLAKTFVDGHAALVRFTNVKSYGRSAMYQDFSVSPAGAAPGALIGTNYLRASGMYTSMPDGTTYKSITGVVLADFCGGIWPRNMADIVP